MVNLEQVVQPLRDGPGFQIGDDFGNVSLNV